MKTFLTAALLLATTLAASPGASACDVTDPTGATATCIDLIQYATNDCQSAEGAQFTGLMMYSMGAQHYATGGLWDYCEVSASRDYDASSRVQYAEARIHPIQAFANARHSEYNAHDGCSGGNGDRSESTRVYAGSFLVGYGDLQIQHSCNDYPESASNHDYAAASVYIYPMATAAGAHWLEHSGDYEECSAQFQHNVGGPPSVHELPVC